MKSGLLFSKRMTSRLLRRYQAERHGSSWLTPRYLQMLLAASRDPRLNFSLHALEA